MRLGVFTQPQTKPHVIMSHYKRLKCMTLIELLTALGITMLLLMISIPIFTKQAKAGNVEASARVAEGFINRGRNFAFNPNREFPASYRVQLQNATDNKSIQGYIYGKYYSTPDQTGDPIEETVDQISISGVFIPSNSATVYFKPVTGEVLSSDFIPFLGFPMTIQSVSNSDSRKISINSLGNVEVSSP